MSVEDIAKYYNVPNVKISELKIKTPKTMNPFNRLQKLELEVEQLNKTLNRQAEKIKELQSPFKFNVGSKVNVKIDRGHNKNEFTGIIVKRHWDHNNFFSQKYYSVLVGEIVADFIYESEISVI